LGCSKFNLLTSFTSGPGRLLVQLQTLGKFVDNAGQWTVVLHYNMDRVKNIKVGFLMSNSDRGHGRTKARGSAQLFNSC
jgi:hypothetical protein